MCQALSFACCNKYFWNTGFGLLFCMAVTFQLFVCNDVLFHLVNTWISTLPGREDSLGIITYSSLMKIQGAIGALNNWKGVTVRISSPSVPQLHPASLTQDVQV